MGQQASRKTSSSGCGCGCGSWERRDAPGHVQRYMSAVTDRWSGRSCACGRWRPPAVCTAYRHRQERDDRLAAVLDALVINAGDSDPHESGEPVNAEVYVLSVTRPVDSEESRQSELQHPDGSIRLHPHFQVVCGNELRALLLRTPTDPPRVHTQVDYIHCLVPDLQEITACAYYWGKMDRYEAERLLDNKPEGTFLLRDSAQEEHLFSVSFRKYGRSLHARIEHYQQRFSFDSHDPAVYSADAVTALIDHYKDPSCVMFFEPTLSSPLPRSQPFSLQQLTRAVLVSHITYDGVDQLPLPSRLRAYLKEYHYRQRVRVRRLDVDYHS